MTGGHAQAVRDFRGRVPARRGATQGWGAGGAEVKASQ